MNIRKISLFIIACMTLSLVSMTFMSLSLADSNTGAVFTATNPDPTTGQHNGIVMYNRAADGTLTLTPGSPFLTPGYGSGPNPVPQDPIASVGSLAVDDNNQFLFAVNSGSNQVSVFSISPTGLTHVQTVSSGGTFPVSLTVYNNLLYVLNSGNTPGFTGFQFDQTGHLTPLPGGQCNFLAPLNYWPIVNSGKPEIFAAPSQIGFTPDGNKLVIIRKEGPTIATIFTGPTLGPGRIDIYPLNNVGIPVDCNNPAVNINSRANIPQALMPFGFTFSDKGYLVVMEVVGKFIPGVSPFYSSALSSYQIKPSGLLKVRTASLPTGETAVCWIERSGQYLYAANNFGDSISKLKVNPNGTLTLLNAREAIIGTVSPSPPTAFPVDMGITGDQKFLYELTPGSGLIHEFKVDKDNNGNLIPIGIIGILGAPLSGQVGMALAEFGGNDN